MMRMFNREIDMQTNGIYWLNWEQRQFYGWSHKYPKKNDVLLSKMQSGKVFKLKVTSIEYHPRENQFIGTAKDIGYE